MNANDECTKMPRQESFLPKYRHCTKKLLTPHSLATVQL